jgi:RNA polymerase sigma factor (sigma-70 family)
VGLPLRVRSDEQLVALFRAGNDDAFDVIHDRYRQRLFAYTRQMLPGSRQDAEDALQDVFVRAFGGLRASNRQLALRAWLYRVAHNRCIDELRRPPLPSPEALEFSAGGPSSDPIAIAEQRDALRQLIEDVRRLPEQQRSALLMRELSDMSYAELAAALDASVPAVKSLLVRARIGLAKAAEARDTACSSIREELCAAHDRGVRPSGTARRHLRDCQGCRTFRRDMRGVTRQLAALTPALGPAGVLAKLVGFGGGAGGTAAGGSAAVAGGGAVTAGGILTGGASHLATLIAAAVITAGGAVELQQTIAPNHARSHRAARVARSHAQATTVEPSTASTGGVSPSAPGGTPSTDVASSSGPATTAGGRIVGEAQTGSTGGTSSTGRGSRGPASGLADMTAPSSTYDTTDSTATGTAAGTGAGSDTSGTSTGTGSGTLPLVSTGPGGTITIGSPSSTPSTASGSGTGSTGTSSTGTDSGTSAGDTTSAGTGSSGTSGGASATTASDGSAGDACTDTGCTTASASTTSPASKSSS